jgi:hypothetical protein
VGRIDWPSRGEGELGSAADASTAGALHVNSSHTRHRFAGLCTVCTVDPLHTAGMGLALQPHYCTGRYPLEAMTHRDDQGSPKRAGSDAFS